MKSMILTYYLVRPIDDYATRSKSKIDRDKET